MKTRQRWSLFAALLVTLTVGAATFLAIGEKEPTHAGKPLSQWLDELVGLGHPRYWERETEQARAVRAISTNALPWLLAEMRVKGSRWQWEINQRLAKQKVIKYRFPNSDARLRRATIGFQALGELAQPAIPELLTLLESKPGYVPGALAAIGPAAVPALQQCLTNTCSFATSIGPFAPIPGNTIGAVHNAMIVGRLTKKDVSVLVPAIREWNKSTNGHAARYAADFLKAFDQR